MRDGQALGKVVEEAARRYRMPLAFAHIDLTLEKTVLCEMPDIPTEAIPTYHFRECPGEAGEVGGDVAREVRFPILL